MARGVKSRFQQQDFTSIFFKSRFSAASRTMENPWLMITCRKKVEWAWTIFFFPVSFGKVESGIYTNP